MHPEYDRYFTFRSFRLNPAERSLFKNDAKLALTPRAFDVLTFLVSRAGHLVEKEELLRVIWKDSFVEEANLARIVHTLRRTLGENGSDKFIETVAKKGYRFVAPVDEVIQPVVRPNGNGSRSQTEIHLGLPVSGDNARRRVSRPGTRYALFAAGVAGTVLLAFLLSFDRGPNGISAKRFTTNEEASRLYQLGAALATKSGRKNAEKAVEYFTQVITLDPNYAPAYAGLASAHTSMAITAGGDTHEQYIKAKTAIEKAMAIDNDLAETHSAMGELKWICEWDFAGAETAHKRALELDPNIVAAHRKYAAYLLSMGRFDEAIGVIKVAIDLEPALPTNHSAYAQILLYARRYDEAIVRSKQTLEMDPDFLVAHNFLIGAYRAKGDDEQAFEWFMRLETERGARPEELESWRTTYAKDGWRGIYERQLEQAKEAERNGDPNYMYLANLSTELDRPDDAFAYLEKAYAQRQWVMVMLNVNPRYDPLRSDPRFEDLLKRVGLR